MLVLPIYYAALTAMTSSRWMRRLFPGRRKHIHNKDSKERSASEGDKETSIMLEEEQQSDTLDNRKRGGIVLCLAPAVWSFITLSEKVEEILSLPGSGIAFISILSCIASKAISSLYETKIQSEIGEVTQQLSDVCYYMLLSAIGVSMNLRRLTLEGGWASCSSVLFAMTPLLVHFAVILFGSLGVTRLFPNYKLGIEDIAAASNAGICGPFTAAALVGKLASGERKGSNLSIRWKGLALASTFWGIVGYAVATNIGVSLSKALLLRMK